MRQQYMPVPSLAFSSVVILESWFNQRFTRKKPRRKETARTNLRESARRASKAMQRAPPGMSLSRHSSKRAASHRKCQSSRSQQWKARNIYTHAAAPQEGETPRAARTATVMPPPAAPCPLSSWFSLAPRRASRGPHRRSRRQSQPEWWPPLQLPLRRAAAASPS